MKIGRLTALNYCTNYLVPMPDITIYMNCDTYLAVNLSAFDIGEHDEFIFVIKNHDYLDSSYAFLYRAYKSDVNENGEIIFNIDPDASKKIKQGAIYSCAILVNALSYNEPSEYVKLTENGKVRVEFGTYDLALAVPEEPQSSFREVIAARIEATDEESTCDTKGAIIDFAIEESTDII